MTFGSKEMRCTNPRQACIIFFRVGDTRSTSGAHSVSLAGLSLLPPGASKASNSNLEEFHLAGADRIGACLFGELSGVAGMDFSLERASFPPAETGDKPLALLPGAREAKDVIDKERKCSLWNHSPRGAPPNCIVAYRDGVGFTPVDVTRCMGRDRVPAQVLAMSLETEPPPNAEGALVATSK